ncbi:MAG: DUF4398 domain-containing protein [Geobacteraceae bacterium]|nr:DUF4398 domain-containing protein [Geobacteraceae bacterium]
MNNHVYRLACAITLCGLMGVSGCAGNGKALTEQIANTEKSIAAARDGNASTSAPLELKLADEKLRAAKAAADKKEYDQARTLLEEAQVDADLARAKSESAKAQQFRDSIKALLKEIERGQKAQEIYYH